MQTQTTQITRHETHVILEHDEDEEEGAITNNNFTCESFPNNFDRYDAANCALSLICIPSCAIAAPTRNRANELLTCESSRNTHLEAELALAPNVLLLLHLFTTHLHIAVTVTRRHLPFTPGISLGDSTRLDIVSSCMSSCV